MRNSVFRFQNFGRLGFGRPTALAASFFVVLTVSGASEENKEKGRAEALQELKLLKNTPELLKTEAGNGVVLPPIAAPDAPALTLSQRPVFGQKTLENEEKEAKKGQNWLIEGYWQQVREHTRNTDQKGRAGSDWMRNTLGSGLWVKTDSNLQASGDSLVELEESPKRELGAKELSTQEDPLLPFLSTWLSSRDYQILHKTAQAGEGALMSGSQSNEQSQAGRGAEMVAENLYLKALSEGVKSGEQTGSPVVSAPVQAPSAGLGASPLTPGNAPILTPVPEPEKAANPLSQRDEDRKYYPQLKRF